MRPRNILRWIAFATSAVVVGATGATGCGLTVTGEVDVSALEAGGPESGPVSSSVADASEDEAQAPLVVCGAPHTCVPVPTSWSIVTIVDSRGAGDLTFATTKDCPAGWTGKQTGIETPHGATGTCSCTCGGPTSTPCQTSNNYSLNLSTNGGGTCNDATDSAIADGSCQDVGAGTWPGATNGVMGSAQGAKSVSCSQTTTLPGLVSDGAFAVCSLAASVGACAGGTCLDAPTTPVCLARNGTHDCPTGSYARHVIVPPAKITDGRSCAPCGCNSTASSCTTSLTLYTMTKCNGQSRSMALDGTCAPATGMPAPMTYRITSTPNTLACSTVTPAVAVQGAVGTDSELTLCCPP